MMMRCSVLLRNDVIEIGR